MPSSPTNDCLMLITPAAAAATAAAAAATANFACASVFPSTADAAHTSFLKRKRGDMIHYASTARNALCFFASATRAANKCDDADYKTLKHIAAAKFKRQRAAIGLDEKKAAAAYASAAADTARRSHTAATSAMAVTHNALQDARHLANAATIVAMSSPHVSFTLYINNMHELEDSYNSCNAAVAAAYDVLADAILDLDKATEAVKAAEAKEAKVKGDEAVVTSMLETHQRVADEYTEDALKIQQQMEDLIAEREYADKADFAILASIIANATRGGKRCRASK
jgi:hypothetical protein